MTGTILTQHDAAACPWCVIQRGTIMAAPKDRTTKRNGSKRTGVFAGLFPNTDAAEEALEDIVDAGAARGRHITGSTDKVVGSGKVGVFVQDTGNKVFKGQPGRRG